jgi:hypothetical protein
MTNKPHNQNSTCEWVDEAYSRRLWAQLLARRFPNRATLLTVRNGGYVIEGREKGRRYWMAEVFAPGPGNALDVMYVVYDAAGRRIDERTVLRITEHAGQRMFQRLRTNSAADLARTASEALYAVQANRALWPEDARQGEEAELPLSWGRFHLVADGGVWVAKTFIPADVGARHK